MKSRQLIVVAAACLVAAGCRADPNTVLLERQLRLQEDEIYRLRACVEDYQEALDVCDGDGTVLSEPAGKSGSPRSDAVMPGLPDMNIKVPGRSQTDVPETLKPGKRQNSVDPIPVPDKPVFPRPSGEGGGQAPPFNPGAGPSGATAQPHSTKVASLVLNRMLCGGYNADGRPGDEGITVVLEPRDAHGRIVKAPADVSVVVLDQALDGEAARVARWDFSATDLAGRFSTGQGMLIQSTWPAARPLHGDLHLFVRYTTHDGRRFEVDRPIRVVLAEERSPGWVPREPTADDVQANISSPQPRIPISSSRIASRPAETKLQRPVWSPNRL